MIKVNIQKIKQEVEKRKGKVVDTIPKIDNLNIINKNSITFTKKDIYTYSDFTKYHDEEFINNIYIGLLNREADVAGSGLYLELLRSGKRNKDDIVTSIRYSKEGKLNNIKLIHSRKKYLLYILGRLPIIGYMLKWTKAFITLPNIISRLNSYENYIARESIISNNNDLLLEKTINELNHKLEEEINLNQTIKQNLLNKIDSKVSHEDMKDFYINIKNLNSSMEQKLSHEDMQDFYINIKNLNSSMEQKVSHEDMQDFYLNIKNLNESIVQKVSYEDMKDFYINIKNLNSSMEQKVSHEDMKDFYINIKNLNSSMEQKLSHEDMQDFYLNIKNLNESIVQKVSYEDIDSLNNLINSKASSKDFELYMKSVGYAKDYMKLSQENIQTLINEVKKRLPPKKLLNKKELISIVEEEKYKFDSFYIEFEDKFRGSREDIKKRVEVYLPYIEKLSTIKDNIEILDVGCGRGEWLELLKENGYNKIKGIDINRIMVSKSQELGLDVKEYDVIEYLKSLESNSLSVITGFHIIEHLPFEILMKMFEESYRVLKKGGLVIFETPNPENLVVGAYTFYTDITHRNPIPFATSEFLIQYSGFTSTEIKRVNYSNIVEPLENKHLNHHLRTGEDYSIIGYKG